MPESAKVRVMIVEDDRVAREALAELIRLWGYRPETASDGVEALEKLRDSHPIVLISDLQMPRMGGVELLRALRKAAPDISCIVLTSEGGADKAAVVRAAGAIDLLEKPVDARRLRRDLQRCLKQHAGSA
jgi:DNA-binding NtrC family response regulator